MDKISIVLELLKLTGIDASATNEKLKSIKWKSSKGDEYEIIESDIDCSANNVAWFQSSFHDDLLLVKYENGERFEWVPETYNPAFGCTCIHLEWRGNTLLYIYLEKHDLYVCSINGRDVRHYNFHGEDLNIGKEFVSVGSFGYEKRNEVELLNLPDLDKVKKVTLEEAKSLGLLPKFYQNCYQ
jgi:hypothetical protein